MSMADAARFDSEMHQGKCGVGILCGSFSGIIAVDIDVDDVPEHNIDTAKVVDRVRKCIGVTPMIKIGNRGCTLFYRYTNEKAGNIVLLEQDGERKKQQIQILADGLNGDGKNCVIPPSIHPVTKEPFIWVSEPTAEDIANLPVITEAQWKTLYEEFDSTDKLPIKRPPGRPKSTTTEIIHTFNQGVYQNNDAVYELVCTFLQDISPVCTDDIWYKTGLAINHAITGDKGAALFTDWSAQSPQWEEHLEQNKSRVYNIFHETKPTGGEQITVLKLGYLAKQSNPLFVLGAEQKALYEIVQFQTQANRIDIGEIPTNSSFKYMTPGKDHRSIASMIVDRYAHHMRSIDGEELRFFHEARGQWEIWTSKGAAHFMSTYDTVMPDVHNTAVFLRACLNAEGAFMQRRLDAELITLGNISSLDGVRRTILQGHANLLPHTSYNDATTKPDILGLTGRVKIDLRTGAVSEIVAADNIMMMAPVTYDATARCPLWEKFLLDVFANNENAEAMVKCIQMLFGYCLTGHVDLEKVIIFLGSGNNGKSLVLEALVGLLGNGQLANSTDADGFVTRKNTADTSLVMHKLEGKRVCVIKDMNSQAKWEEQVIKAITDTEITSRVFYSMPRKSQNTCKCIFATNGLPSLSELGAGVARRMIVIPFDRSFPQQHEEGHIGRRVIENNIKSELPGILNWALEGTRMYYAAGSTITVPGEARQETSTYISDSNPWITAYRAVCVKPTAEEPGEPYTSTEIYAAVAQAFDHYCTEVGLPYGTKKPMAPSVFGRQLNKDFKGTGQRYNSKTRSKVAMYTMVLRVPESKEELDKLTEDLLTDITH